MSLPAMAVGACALDPHLAADANRHTGVATADVVLFNGDIHSADAQASRHAALAIRANQIIAVGSDADILALAGRHSRRINLGGRTVLPGINDSHLHLLMWSLARPPFSLDLTYPNVTSIADAVALVGAQAQRQPRGSWIVGRGWDQPYFAEGRAPTAADLDAVAPDHPVVLTEFSGHAVWANALAMKRAGITADTVPPVGGVIVKDAQGQPTGLLLEGAAWIVRGAVPSPTVAQHKAALRAGMQSLLERGITSCTVPGVSTQILQQMLELADEPNAAKLRVTGLVRSPDSLAGLQEVLADFAQLKVNNPLWLQLPGVKIMGDGIPTGNKTAWLHEEYVGGGNGSLLIKGDTDAERVQELNSMIQYIHGRGLQIGTHVTGDRSIDTVIDALFRARRLTARQSSGQVPLRHYIIHGDLVSPGTLARMSAYQIGANFNPEIKHLIADGQVAALGARRAAYEWPYRTALDAGVVVASSSDAPVTPGNWLQGIATMVDRKGLQSGEVSGPEQRVTLDEAVRTYTWAGAWQDRAESYKGTLTAGQMADLCVLDARLDELDTSDIPNTSVVLTMVDGQIVHDRT